MSFSATFVIAIILRNKLCNKILFLFIKKFKKNKIKGGMKLKKNIKLRTGLNKYLSLKIN